VTEITVDAIRALERVARFSSAGLIIHNINPAYSRFISKLQCGYCMRLFDDAWRLSIRQWLMSRSEASATLRRSLT